MSTKAQPPAITARASDAKAGIGTGLVALMVLIFIAYSGLWYADFVTLDDGNHVFDNPVVNDGLTWPAVKESFTTFPAELWVPLTWVSLATEVSLIGNDPTVHHIGNLLLHMLATGLLFWAMRRLLADSWAALIAALLFGLHPLNVESVAWITERKNVLSAVFWMLSLGAYARYAKEGKWGSYWCAVAAMAGGILSKPAVVPLPCVFLLLDVWPLNRFTRAQVWRVLVEKVPFFALAALSSLMTIKAQGAGGALVGTEYISILTRIAYASECYVWYFSKLFLPVSLAPHYPHPVVVPLGPAALAFALLLAITGICLWQFRRRPYLIIGWLWFIGVLVPTIGLVQVGGVAKADRFTYLPQIGIWMALGIAAAPYFAGAAKQKAALISGGIALLLTMLTARQVRYWENTIALFERAIEVTPNDLFALRNAARARSFAGDYKIAVNHYYRALEGNTEDPSTWDGLGATLLRLNQHERARIAFEQALKYEPDDAPTEVNLAMALIRLKRGSEARGLLQKALVKDPGIVKAHYQLALLLEREGDRDGAIRHFQKAAELRPKDPKTQEELARILAGKPQRDAPEMELPDPDRAIGAGRDSKK